MAAKRPDGNYPALEYVAASLARDIISARRRVGLSQAELARRAGIRVETLNRIERMKDPPSVRTVEKIDRALKAAETDGNRPGRKPTGSSRAGR
jgi:transcriptional regulator with XRE-family HTH domain